MRIRRGAFALKAVDYFALMELRGKIMRTCYDNDKARDLVAAIDRKLSLSSMS